MPTTPRKKTLFILFTVACTGLSALLVAEATLRLLQPKSDRYLALPPSTSAIFSTARAGVSSPALYQTNSLGVRGREWSEDRSSELRVLAVGGSTTECLIIDQARVWTSLLEQQLGKRHDGRQTWVGNIGRSGLSSRHHVVEARHLLDVYDPDVVTLLVGVNDLSSRLKHGGDYDPYFMEDSANVRLVVEQAFAVTPEDVSGVHWTDDPWFKRTRLWGLLRTIKYQRLNVSLSQDTNGQVVVHWREMRASGKRTAELPSLESALDEYERNLISIIDSVNEHGAKLLLMTQPSLWQSDLEPEVEALLWMGGIGDFRTIPGSLYYTPAALAEGMAAYNSRLLKVCEDRGVQCLDLANLIPKTTEYFYDDCHFTDEANRLIARAVAETLERALGSSSAAAPASRTAGSRP